MLSHGLFTIPREIGDHGKRLAALRVELEKLIRTFAPACIAVEKLFFTKNVKTAMRVGEARGVVMLVAGTLGIPVVEFTPNEIKVAVTGYGRAEKMQVQKMVKTLLALPELPSPDDVADALAVAYTGSLYA